MTRETSRMWQALADADHPLPATVLKAALRHAFTTETVGNPDAEILRRRLIARGDVTLTDAAHLAGWPGDNPDLTAAYLQRPDHPAGALPGLLATAGDDTRTRLADISNDPRLLALLGAHPSPRCARALIRNGHTPSPTRIDALRHLLETGDPYARRLICDLDGPDAVALADRTHELQPLTWLIASHRLPVGLHGRLADVILTELDPAAPQLDADHPVAVAIGTLGDRAIPGTYRLRRLLADQLTAAGIHIGGRPAAALLVDPAPADALTAHDWGALLRRLPRDGEAVDDLAALLDARLGSNVDAWDAFAALGAGHTGTLEELLTAAAAVGAPADPPAPGPTTP